MISPEIKQNHALIQFQKSSQRDTGPLMVTSEVQARIEEIKSENFVMQSQNVLEKSYSSAERVKIEEAASREYKARSFWQRIIAGESLREADRQKAREQVEANQTEESKEEYARIEEARHTILATTVLHPMSSKGKKQHSQFHFAETVMPKAEDLTGGLKNKDWRKVAKWSKEAAIFGAKVYAERGFMVTFAASTAATILTAGAATLITVPLMSAHRGYKSIHDIGEANKHAQYEIEMARLKLLAEGSAGEDMSLLQRAKITWRSLQERFGNKRITSLKDVGERGYAYMGGVLSLVSEETAISRAGVFAHTRMENGHHFISQREALLSNKTAFIAERRMLVCEQITQLVEKGYIADESTIPELAQLKVDLEATFSNDPETKLLRAQIAKEVAQNIGEQEKSDRKWSKGFVLRKTAVRAALSAGGIITAVAAFLHVTAPIAEAASEHMHTSLLHESTALPDSSHLATVPETTNPVKQSFDSILNQYKAKIGSVSFEQNPVLQQSFHMQMEHGKLLMQGSAGQGNGVAFSYPNGETFIVQLDPKTHTAVIDLQHLDNTMMVIKGNKAVPMTQREIIEIIVGVQNPKTADAQDIVGSLQHMPDGTSIDAVWQKTGVSPLSAKASLIDFSHASDGTLHLHYIASSGIPEYGHHVDNIILTEDKTGTNGTGEGTTGVKGAIPTSTPDHPTPTPAITPTEAATATPTSHPNATATHEITFTPNVGSHNQDNKTTQNPENLDLIAPLLSIGLGLLAFETARKGKDLKKIWNAGKRTVTNLQISDKIHTIQATGGVVVERGKEIIMDSYARMLRVLHSGEQSLTPTEQEQFDQACDILTDFSLERIAATSAEAIPDLLVNEKIIDSFQSILINYPEKELYEYIHNKKILLHEAVAKNPKIAKHPEVVKDTIRLKKEFNITDQSNSEEYRNSEVLNAVFEWASAIRIASHTLLAERGSFIDEELEEASPTDSYGQVEIVPAEEIFDNALIKDIRNELQSIPVQSSQTSASDESSMPTDSNMPKEEEVEIVSKSPLVTILKEKGKKLLKRTIAIVEELDEADSRGEVTSSTENGRHVTLGERMKTMYISVEEDISTAFSRINQRLSVSKIRESRNSESLTKFNSEVNISHPLTINLLGHNTQPYAAFQSTELAVVGLTDTGTRKNKNEDSVLVAGGAINGVEYSISIVADGVSMSKGGEIASMLAIETTQAKLPTLFYQNLDLNSLSDKEIIDGVVTIVEEANRAVYKRAQEPLTKNIATTMSIALTLNNKAYVANVGDSRIYTYKKRRGLHLISDDQSVGNKSLALGVEENTTIFSRIVPLEEDEILLLCSDGLTKQVEKENIEKVLSEEQPTYAIYKLVELANNNGGEDNISVILVRGFTNQKKKSAKTEQYENEIRMATKEENLKKLQVAQIGETIEVDFSQLGEEVCDLEDIISSCTSNLNDIKISFQTDQEASLDIIPIEEIIDGSKKIYWQVTQMSKNGKIELSDRANFAHIIGEAFLIDFPPLGRIEEDEKRVRTEYTFPLNQKFYIIFFKNSIHLPTDDDDDE